MDDGHDTGVEEALRKILELLSGCPEGMTRAELAARLGAGKGPAVRRATRELQEAGAKLEFDRASRRWVLREPFHIPLRVPREDDLIALMIGHALIAPVVGPELSERIQALINDMSDRIEAQSQKPPRMPLIDAVTRDVTMATSGEVATLRTMLVSLRSGVVRITYDKPWADETVVHVVEPWGLRFVDSAVYVRGWCRERKAARTYNLASVLACTKLDDKPRHRPAPPAEQVWGEGDPAYGVDHDQPGTAVITLRGAAARWSKRFRWHGAETIEVLGNDRVRRTVSYRSRREFARKLLGVLDAIESVEPAELREQLEEYVGAYRRGRVINC